MMNIRRGHNNTQDKGRGWLLVRDLYCPSPPDSMDNSGALLHKTQEVAYGKLGG
jgi:hypothetical protein